MITTLNAITPVFLIILIGYGLFRSGTVGESVWSAIEHICFYLLLPMLIIRTLSRADLSDIPVLDFMLVLVFAILAMSALLLVVNRVVQIKHPDSGPSFTSLFQGATRYHGFVALATIGPLYGDEGVALAALSLAIMVPLLNVISVTILSIYGSQQENLNIRQLLIRIAQNPLIIACGIGLSFNFFGVPDIVFETVDIIGRGGLGLALLSVGAGIRFNQAARDKFIVTIGVVLRLIGMPVMVLIMCWIVELEGLARTVAIISGAVPTAATSYVMARKMGGNAELMSSIVTFQIVAAFFTLPLFIYIAENG